MTTEKKENLNPKKRKYSFFLFMILIILLTAMIALIKDSIIERNDLYFSKDIKQKINKTINGGAGLTFVKHVYEKRIIKQNQFHPIYVSNKESKYPITTSFQDILNDLFVDYYESNQSDTVYLKKLQRIYDENLETNPFDKLQENQKYFFNNIRSMLGSDYDKIETDLNKISEELNYKNEMVEKYLDKSTSSFWIAIIGLVLSIALSSYQIYQNWGNNNRIKTTEKE